ncbi:TPA: hypothetical protein DCW38_03130, partial [candidate division WOR-3 bacterium]|nr:hypothetical protein [candidate division WOR-3 bacterium]
NDNQDIEMVKGFRIQHLIDSLPMFGGLRIHPSFSSSDGKINAFKNTMKSSIMELGFSGSSGAINLDFSKYSADEIDRVIDSYIGSVLKNVGPDNDIFGTDVNVNSALLLRVRQSYANRTVAGKNLSECFSATDASAKTGQENFTKDANGLSVSLAVEEWGRRRNIDIDSMTVVIQGFGNTGYSAGKILKEHKATIVGIQTNFGSFYNPYGIDLNDFEKQHRAATADKNIESAKKIDSGTFYTIKTDVFISSGYENMIGRESASLLNAKCVVEGADNAVSEDGENILKERGIYIIPDIIASSGGIFFGTAGNRTSKKTGRCRDILEKSLSERISRALDSIERTAHENNLHSKESAVLFAVRNLIKNFG